MADTITVGSLTVENITGSHAEFVASFVGDDNANSTCQLAFKLGTDSEWTDITTTPGTGVFTGSLAGLVKGTHYNVRATFADADGQSGTNPAVADFDTLASFFLSNGAGVITGYDVAGSGIDETVPGSIGGVATTSIGTVNFSTHLPGVEKLSGTLTFPSSITSIGSGAFINCTGLTSLSLPADLTSIGSGAFKFCSGLTGTLTIPSNVITIAMNAFWGCSGITTLTLPDTALTLGNNVFANCSVLTDTRVHTNYVIGTTVFNTCSDLTVQIPTSKAAIWTPAFFGCKAVANIGIVELDELVISNIAHDVCNATLSVLDDENEDATVEFGISLHDADTWVAIPALQVIRTDNNFIAQCLDLDELTEYDVKATITDADGIRGAAFLVSSFSTLENTDAIETGAITFFGITDDWVEMVIVAFADDLNEDATCVLTYHPTLGDPTPIPLVADRFSGSGVGQFVGQIAPGLDDNTEYTVVATFEDADGVQLTNPRTATFTTLLRPMEVQTDMLAVLGSELYAKLTRSLALQAAEDASIIEYHVSVVEDDDVFSAVKVVSKEALIALICERMMNVPSLLTNREKRNLRAILRLYQ